MMGSQKLPLTDCLVTQLDGVPVDERELTHRNVPRGGYFPVRFRFHFIQSRNGVLQRCFQFWDAISLENGLLKVSVLESKYLLESVSPPILLDHSHKSHKK